MNEIENDNEIIFMVAENNEDASDYLISKYEVTIKKIARKYVNRASLFGFEEKDLVQEGLLGLIQSFYIYNPDRDSKFSTFAFKCIENRILSSLAKQGNYKNKILNESLSLDYVYINSNKSLFEFVGEYNTMDYIINKDLVSEIYEFINLNFKGNTKRVFELKMEGYSADEITEIMNISKHAVENSMFRIRSKLRKKFNELYY